MALTVISKNYATRNYPAGNNFLLANSGQIVTETLNFIVDFDFISTTQNLITFPSLFQIQLLGSNWSDFGFNIGDEIELTGTITQGSSTINYSGYSVTITDLNGDTITVDTTLDPASSGILIGAIMPQTSVGNTALSIVNVTASTPQALEYWHNIVPNSVAGSVNSLIDGEVNRFSTDQLATLVVGGSLQLLQLGDRSGGSYFGSTVTRIADVSGKKAYSIELVYDFPYKFEDGDFAEPSFFTAAQSLKPYFELLVIPQVNNPNAQLRYVYGAYLGNTGWLNENYNQGLNDFLVTGFSITNNAGDPVDEIDYSAENIVRFKVASTGAISEIFELEFYRIPTAQDYKNKPQSHAQLINLANSFFDAGETSQAYGIGGDLMEFSDVSITLISPSIIEVKCLLTPNSDFTQLVDALPEGQRQYRLTINVQDDSGTANNNNAVTLNLKQGQLTKNPVQGGVFPGIETQEFYNHAGELATPRFTTEDDFRYKAVFNLDKFNAYQSLQTTVVIERVSDGAEFELLSRLIPFANYVTTPNGIIQIQFNEPIQQFLDNPDANKLTLALDGSETSELYGVELNWSLMANWRYWIAQSNAFNDFFDNALPLNGLNAEWMRYLRIAGYDIKVKCNIIDQDNTEFYFETPFILSDYDSEENVTCDIQLFDAQGNAQNTLLANQIMRAKAVFTIGGGAGLWDAPFIWGWFSIRPNEADPNKRLSTVWDWSAQDKPLQPVAGFTNLKIDIISATVVHLVCDIDTTVVAGVNNTLVARINQVSEKGNFAMVHKENFAKITLPSDAIREDKGAVFCSEPQLVLASLEDAAYYKNDRTGIAYKFDEMTIELEDKQGNLSAAPGISVNFPHQPDAKGFVIDWRQVAVGSVLTQGCYKVRVNWELQGNSGWFYFGSYNLVEYSPFNALGTVRLFVVLDDLVRKQGINYKDSGFATTLRFRGQFGYMQPKYETENIIYTDRRREKVRNESLRTYELRSSYLLSCMTRLIDEETLLTANQIYISDHNANNHVQDLYYDYPVILSEEESPTFEYTDSVYAKVKAAFVDKVAYYESKYDGSIKGSENIILQLPTVTTGGGGICENAQVFNSDFSYNVSVPSGGDLELPDTTVNLYIDGALVDSQDVVTLGAATINVIWQ